MDKSERIYFDRWLSFTQEGYRVVFMSKALRCQYVKLMHDNGNIITIIREYRTGNIYQRTNGVLKWQYTAKSDTVTNYT